MPNTRPSLKFDENGVCYACLHFERQKTTDWNKRWKELEELCDKYRSSNGNGPDCAISVSGGKDSHFQTYVIKEKLNMNPILLTVGNTDWTETGRKNLNNISDTFGCDIIQLMPNRRVTRIMTRKTFEDIGQPSWYVDSLVYAYPYRMAMNLGIKLLVYGEDVNYTYGGKFDEETPSALMQPENEIARPYKKEWLEDEQISDKDLDVTVAPSLDECKKFGLEPIYLSYFVPWNSHHNYQVAERWGFSHLGHEYTRENSIDNYDQVDSLSYLFNPFMKFLKFGHSVATDNASRWIRYGMKTREEMIPIVEEIDGKLDVGIVEKFREFVQMTPREFTEVMDKWYNQDLFEQDRDGVWNPKFKVGQGLVK